MGYPRLNPWHVATARAASHPETVFQKLRKFLETTDPLHRLTMRIVFISSFALAGTVAAAAAIALGTSAASLPHRQAAESHAIPLLATAALSAALLGTAAGACTDRRS